MSHKFLDGMIYHKRLSPKEHNFSYKYFMLDMDLDQLNLLNKPSLFSLEKFNLFSFFSKDHFGSSKDFLNNVHELLQKFDIDSNETKLRFITLPSILGFVFNPISLLLVIKDNEPQYLLAEVHNYNGGRTIHPVKLKKENQRYLGMDKKDMYVSPFFNRVGEYSFVLEYFDDKFSLQVSLFEENKKVFTSSVNGIAKEFSNSQIKKLFFKHTFLTLYVVTRTFYEGMKLFFKGLKINKPLQIDKVRRY